MAEIENSKDLISVLWSGADILRSKMDANEYKDYLFHIKQSCIGSALGLPVCLIVGLCVTLF